MAVVVDTIKSPVALPFEVWASALPGYQSVVVKRPGEPDVGSVALIVRQDAQSEFDGAGVPLTSLAVFLPFAWEQLRGVEDARVQAADGTNYRVANGQIQPLTGAVRFEVEADGS